MFSLLLLPEPRRSLLSTFWRRKKWEEERPPSIYPFLLPSSSHIRQSLFSKKDGSWPGKAVRRSGSFSHPPPLRPLCIPLPTALGEGRRTRPPARNFYKSSQCQLQIGGRSRRGGERGEEEEEEEVGPVVALLFPPLPAPLNSPFF